MKVYNVSVNGLSFQPSASNRATAIRRALNAYLNDPEVTDWLKQMDELALLPKKR